MQSKTVRHLMLRLNKENAAFVYFTLESNEGICFYSTLGHEKGQSFRDIELYQDQNLANKLDHIIQALQKKFTLEILLDEEMEDQAL